MKQTGTANLFERNFDYPMSLQEKPQNQIATPGLLSPIGRVQTELANTKKPFTQTTSGPESCVDL
jgi:hypothetical protein